MLNLGFYHPRAAKQSGAKAVSEHCLRARGLEHCARTGSGLCFSMVGSTAIWDLPKE